MDNKFNPFDRKKMTPGRAAAIEAAKLRAEKLRAESEKKKETSSDLP